MFNPLAILKVVLKPYFAQDTPETGHACERHMRTLEMAEAWARHTAEPAGIFKEGDGQVIKDMVQRVEAAAQEVKQDLQRLLQRYGVENGDALPKGVKISSNDVPVAMSGEERPNKGRQPKRRCLCARSPATFEQWIHCNAEERCCWLPGSQHEGVDAVPGL